MSPLALCQSASDNVIKTKVINDTPITCPIKKIFGDNMENENTTNCTSILQEQEFLILVKDWKTGKKTSYECEEVYPKNTLEDSHDIVLLKAKKRFTIQKNYCEFAIFKNTTQPNKTILKVLQDKSSSNIQILAPSDIEY